MIERTPEEFSEEENFPIPGTPDEPTLRPSEHYVSYTPPPGAAPLRADADIKHDIESALFYDDLVRSYEVQVGVQQGDVTLSGTVDDNMAAIAAENDACHVPGVKHVANQLNFK